MSGHHWISAPHPRRRERLRDALGLPGPSLAVDAHRRLRGPYTAAGTLLRAFAPEVLRARPGLADRHYIELQQSTPELTPLVPPLVRGLEEQSSAGEISRYPARLHSLRVAHGLVEFLLAALPDATDAPRTLIVTNVEHADVTDQEFLAVALRRIPPELLTIVACSGREPLREPPGEVSISLPEALTTYANLVTGPPEPEPDAGPSAVAGDPAAVRRAARRFVDGDCVGDEPGPAAAYAALTPSERAALHERRAGELAGRVEAGETSWRLGALPYHLLRGTDPVGAGVAAARRALDHCKYLGFYHISAELSEAARAFLTVEEHPDAWWYFIREASACLAAGGRPDESAALQHEARTHTQSATHHMKLAYETGMLYARHYPPERRDEGLARAWVNQAIGIADLLPDPDERAFFSVFNRNGLALVEVRAGRPDEALRLLDEGIERLDRELGLGRRSWHRTGLRYNRAQVNAMSGRLAEALEDYAEILEADAGFSDHHFNRGTILRKLGRAEEAIAEYTRALRLEPPFPEAYYNRGDARLELGDTEGALADFDRTLELEPGHPEASLGRAGLLADLGDTAAALESVTGGLAQHPDHPHLLSLRGRLLAEEGDVPAAREALEAALRNDPGLAEAWAVRAELAYLDGDLDLSVADFDRAVGLADRADFRFNRGVVHEAAGRYGEAAADFEAVLAATGDPDARSRLDDCLRAAGQARA
ncbi:tetratricopeptide repeat protein [Streptomyces sp. CC208A]|uniref:tetratricopeptide repeat protein n=1 Tax=Streptomyces sp. CC208A TaxID=3044573 RepID=UPI0024A80790|nr:tetratricopeptide repeat protein [Streptomyces sp. CC208A]